MFGRRRLDLVFILDDSRVCITSDDTRIVHEVGAIESLGLSWLSVFRFLGGDFGLGLEIELSSCIFYHFLNVINYKLL